MVLRPGFFLRSRGRERLSYDGPMILAANHQSFLDPVMVGVCCPPVLHFMARDSLFRVPVLGRFITAGLAFPVKRGKGDVGAFKQSLRILKGGENLLLFPEGTRTTTGRIRDLQPGVIALARKTKAAVVPVAITGAFEAWPRNAKLPRPRKVWIEFGTPIPSATFEGRSDAESAADLTAELRRLHNNLRRFAGREPFDYPDSQATTDSGTGEATETATSE